MLSDTGGRNKPRAHEALKISFPVPGVILPSDLRQSPLSCLAAAPLSERVGSEKRLIRDMQDKWQGQSDQASCLRLNPGGLKPGTTVQALWTPPLRPVALAGYRCYALPLQNLAKARHSVPLFQN